MIPPAAHRVLGIFALAVCVFSVAPVLVIVAESFTATDYVVFPPPALSFKWYGEFLKRAEFVNSFLVSSTVALGASLVATALGTAASIALVRYNFFGRRVLQQLFLAPLSLPGLIFGLALLQFLARYGMPRNIATITLAHIIITMPFAIRFITVALVGVDRNVELLCAEPGSQPLADIPPHHVPVDQTRHGGEPGFCIHHLLRRGCGIALPVQSECDHPSGPHLHLY